ncbi:hypothetical protein [Mucilaginibacter auburnensis]|uniref:Uncharacterized protein n=1 Tax=Mucilaginibacter auburnensis TaxID=1457233 RepID=A0A2H9VN90_9SPHI|nr:hypothetical protein [Mucilaginibacter auburnensis]PJJ79790.1 hypothetical protein CLV57_2929 [Mucilaginibacter auburnensis]
MKIGVRLQKLLDKIYPPDAKMEFQLDRTDVVFKTDGEGRPVLLFVGRKNADGQIKGERFARTLKKLSDGTMKDHWENKGQTS